MSKKGAHKTQAAGTPAGSGLIKEKQSKLESKSRHSTWRLLRRKINRFFS